ncbi:GntR family transcriptional regulator [Agrococcus jejuensis]|uniref:DNA-binding transcriptional regulator, GntR family n=1 Tax=Agrococcus jejuensis TaxID=399736 RepID=A0A1G8DIG0_9MICO|nr:GntR family transcriptional regulator [Agrococcus jejuensis]SDH57150.1 DNA-binding transcriptional regulator, GntR family [Agrococcus jejuensis]
MSESTTTAPPLERIQVGSLVEEARRQIRRSILAGHLRPGERLKDSVLAEQMGISRSPVREALRLLEQSGLVEKTANRSYRIPTFAPEDIRELAALRAADEILAVRTILRERPPLDSLDAAIEELRGSAGDITKAAAADIGFHRAVVRLAGLPRLVERYETIVDQIRLVLLAGEIEIWGRDERIVQNHTRLLRALQAAYDGGDQLELLREWEFHVVAGMTAPAVLDPL